MANVNISDNVYRPQFIRDLISASERLTTLGVCCGNLKKHSNKYRTPQADRKVCDRYMQNLKISLV